MSSSFPATLNLLLLPRESASTLPELPSTNLSLLVLLALDRSGSSIPSARTPMESREWPSSSSTLARRPKTQPPFTLRFLPTALALTSLSPSAATLRSWTSLTSTTPSVSTIPMRSSPSSAHTTSSCLLMARTFWSLDTLFRLAT